MKWRTPLRNHPLWFRIYWPACTLIAVVIVCITGRMLAGTSAANLQREIASSLAQHRVFGNSLVLYADTLTDATMEETVQLLPAAVRNYARYYTDQDSFIAMSDEEKSMLFSSMPASLESSMKLSPAKDGRRSYVIRRIGPMTVLFVSGWIEIGQRSYR